jgi:hypothetical protein
MSIFFTWKTIPDSIDYFTKEIKYYYGNNELNNINDWNSVYEDLKVKINLNWDKQVVNFNSYLFDEEKIGVVAKCTGDNRFLLTSPLLQIDDENKIEVNIEIPQGFCGESIKIELYFITINNIIDISKARRLPGSIISKIEILEYTKIDTGNWFPIEMYEGNGNTFLTWSFTTLENLDLALSSTLLVLVDKKHPLAANIDTNIELQKMVEMSIFQGLCRKLFTDEIFEEIIERSNANYVWEDKSIGNVFNFIFQNISQQMQINTPSLLKDSFIKKPELFDMVIDKIYTTTL